MRSIADRKIKAVSNIAVAIKKYRIIAINSNVIQITLPVFFIVEIATSLIFCNIIETPFSVFAELQKRLNAPLKNPQWGSVDLTNIQRAGFPALTQIQQDIVVT